MFGDHGNWAAGGWLAMSVMMVLFWGVIIALVLWAVRAGHRSGQRGSDSPFQRADDLLAEDLTHRRLVLHPSL